jgi:phosphoglycerol transferase MdoB-like AlkP superfamily enzyme
MKSSRFQLLMVFYGLSLLLFFFTRLGLLAYSWNDVNPATGDLLKIFSTGLLFDNGFFAYALITPALYLWLLPQRLWRTRLHGGWLRLVIFILTYMTCFIVVAEFFFWEEFNVRFNFISVDYLIYTQEVTENIIQSYPMIPLLAGIFVVTSLLYLLLHKTISRALACDESFLRRGLITFTLMLLPLTSYFFLGQPSRNISSNIYANELASNGPYQFVSAFRNNELDYRQFYTTLIDSQAAELLRQEIAEPNARFLNNNPYDIRREIVHSGPEKKLNVIIITIESLSSDFLTYFGNPNELTPNLDSLINKSIFFENFYATGTRTTRGLEAITLSIPPTPGRSIVKRIGQESDHWSLGNVLGTKGYKSYFIYGGRSYFENMNAFYGGNGYQIVDQSTTPDSEIHFSNAWGMADEDIYRQAMKIADLENDAKKPFLLHLMTTSNHRPYTYPKGRIDIPSGSGRYGAVKYTDHAIGEFLHLSSKQPWFDQTLFVILADHQAGSAGQRSLPIERYHIPMWIYSPAQLQPELVSTLASQIDLPPTLLGILNMSYRSCFFGRDLLLNQKKSGRALIANYQNLGLYDSERMAILEPRKIIRLQEGLGGDKVTEHLTDLQNPLVQRNISYYQGAAFIFEQRLDAWSARDRP